MGLGTFRPVTVDKVEEHHMHSETYQMSKETADTLNLAKKLGKRIISVGTTSTRTLESIMKSMVNLSNVVSLQISLFIHLMSLWQ